MYPPMKLLANTISFFLICFHIYIIFTLCLFTRTSENMSCRVCKGRCTKQKQNVQNICYLRNTLCFTPSGRTWVADREKPFFSLSKYHFPIENYEKIGGTRFFQKPQPFQNVEHFLLLSSCKLLKTSFSDSASKTEYRAVIKSILIPKIFWYWRFESHRAWCV
jgi:hypothetical protein